MRDLRAAVQSNHAPGDKAADMMVVADLDADLLDMCAGQRWLRGRRGSRGSENESATDTRRGLKRTGRFLSQSLLV